MCQQAENSRNNVGEISTRANQKKILSDAFVHSALRKREPSTPNRPEVCGSEIYHRVIFVMVYRESERY